MERISAFMDGELEDHEAAGQVRRLKEDPELRAAWETYHLIGDALRGHTAPDVAERVQQRGVCAMEPLFGLDKESPGRRRRGGHHPPTRKTRSGRS